MSTLADVPAMPHSEAVGRARPLRQRYSGTALPLCVKRAVERLPRRRTIITIHLSDVHHRVAAVAPSSAAVSVSACTGY